MVHRPLATGRELEDLIRANYPDQVDYWLGNDDAAHHTPITVCIECPDCGYENVETIVEKVGLVDLKCLRCETRERNGNGHLNIPLPFGKFKGKTINDVMEKDPSYLVWCVRNFRDKPDLVAQIKSHSHFPNAWADYMNKEIARERRQEAREWGEGQYWRYERDEED